MIGSLGDIVFEVAEKQILTFNDLQFQHSAKFTEHAIHGRKGLLEFTGFSASTASLTISLNVNLGINPREEFKALENMFNRHEAVPFILNDELQGDGLWVIESMTEKRDAITNKGQAQIIEVSLNLKEYIEINNASVSDEEFQNDYYGVGNW